MSGSYYRQLQHDRTVKRIQLAIQDRLSVGTEITKTDLKRLVASNVQVDWFDEALTDLEEVGIIATYKEKGGLGRRPLMIRYEGYARDRDYYTEESHREYNNYVQSQIDQLNDPPAIQNGKLTAEPPEHPIDRLSYEDYMRGLRAGQPTSA